VGCNLAIRLEAFRLSKISAKKAVDAVGQLCHTSPGVREKYSELQDLILEGAGELEDIHDDGDEVKYETFTPDKSIDGGDEDDYLGRKEWVDVDYPYIDLDDNDGHGYAAMECFEQAKSKLSGIPKRKFERQLVVQLLEQAERNGIDFCDAMDQAKVHVEYFRTYRSAINSNIRETIRLIKIAFKL
jgi:hypothetical protein